MDLRRWSLFYPRGYDIVRMETDDRDQNEAFCARLRNCILGGIEPVLPLVIFFLPGVELFCPTWRVGRGGFGFDVAPSEGVVSPPLEPFYSVERVSDHFPRCETALATQNGHGQTPIVLTSIRQVGVHKMISFFEHPPHGFYGSGLSLGWNIKAQLASSGRDLGDNE